MMFMNAPKGVGNQMGYPRSNRHADPYPRAVQHGGQQRHRTGGIVLQPFGARDHWKLDKAEDHRHQDKQADGGTPAWEIGYVARTAMRP